MPRLWSLAAMGARGALSPAVTHRLSHTDSANVTSYQSAAFTPGLNELLVVFVAAANTVAVGTMTDSQSLGFTLIVSKTKASSTDTLYCFIANALAAASSMTVTFDCTGDSSGGVVIQVAGVSNITKTGATAARQSSGENNDGISTPNPIFGASCLTTNPTLGAVFNGSNPCGITEPAGWTEGDDTGFNTPTTGAEYVYRNSGFTGTQITWGSASATTDGSVIVEIDAS